MSSKILNSKKIIMFHQRDSQIHLVRVQAEFTQGTWMLVRWSDAKPLLK